MPPTTDQPADVSATPAARRVAAILAADMVGYSARMEADEAEAVAALAGLRTRIYAEAEAHGGRVFSTAGDGFMLEFATASDAFDAARALAAGDGPPVRIGAHLGEVTPMERGDLLGHGVNVAARIQSRAEPNAPLFSADLQRLLRGERAALLKSKGFISLDKMEERIEVFGLSETPIRQGMSRRARLGVAVGVVVAALAIGGVMLVRTLAPGSHPARMAVLPLSAAGGARADSLARSLRVGLQGQLLANDVDLVSPDALDGMPASRAADRARSLGAGLLLAGSVTQTGDVTHVGLNLSRNDAAAVLWSMDMESLGDTVSLEPQVLVLVSGAIRCAMQDDTLALAADVLRTYLTACSRLEQLDRPELAKTRDLFLKLTVDAPRFSRGFSGLAYVDVQLIARGLPPGDAAAMQAESKTAAERALALNPDDGMAYAALERVAVRRDYAAREALVRRGIQGAPDLPQLLSTLGDLLNETGRSAEAVIVLERAHALHPNVSYISSALAYSWTATGRDRQAAAMNAVTMAQWPGYPGALRVSMRTLIWKRRASEARAIAQTLANTPARLSEAEISEWNEITAALPEGDGTPTPQGLETIKRLALTAKSDVSTDAILQLARWDLDAAFAAARRKFVGTDYRVLALFNPPGRLFWRDRRYMELMRDVGLLAYWRSSGLWPDFCREPDLGYDCKAEAQRILPAT